MPSSVNCRRRSLRSANSSCGVRSDGRLRAARECGPLGPACLPAKRIATRSEHVIAPSQVSIFPPFQSQHPWSSVLSEVCWCVLPSGFRCDLPRPMQQVSLAGPLLPRACDRAQAPSPRSSGARNMQEPSGDDCSVVPTAGGIHPRSIRVARLYAELVSFPGSRNRDKSHGLDGRTVAPIQRE